MCSESKLPQPSSIAIKFGRGNADTLISAMRIAKDEINENGNIKPQAVDYSKLVPILIKYTIRSKF